MAMWQPRKGGMFIERNRPHPPAPFGGAEFKLTSIHPVAFRPSERRTVFGGARGYSIALLRS